VGSVTGFIDVERRKPPSRPIVERVRDWREIQGLLPVTELRDQAARCMDCSVPFCHQGCPLGNLVPDWNDLIYRDRWRDAFTRLAATNNFPEFTGRLCPAPCEGSCVLGINSDAVTIKSIEVALIDRAFEEGWVVARPPIRRSGARVAVIGSGPAGLAVADQLNRAGHLVTVYERSDRIGGLLRYGIPEFKLEKRLLDRRVDILRHEGVTFLTGQNVGGDVAVSDLRREFDAIVLAAGASRPRDLQVPGRDLAGIHFAVEYLTQQNRRCAGDGMAPDRAISAEGKRVIIIGGGDTGADCLGTAHRQGARAVHQLEVLPRPPDERAPENPWPQWPNIFRISSSHEEGGERLFSVSTERFGGNPAGQVTTLHGVSVRAIRDNGRVRFEKAEGSEFELPADLVLLAMGFTGPEPSGMLADLGVRMTERGTVWRDENWMTSVPGVFAAGDVQRGQSLIVWAIADGRSAARGVDAYLMGESSLPAPV
jgi:glutamate synthase (NADPH/NADH) small chain